MAHPPDAFLDPTVLDGLAAAIDRHRALPWPAAPSAGDTVWLGAVDGHGLATSFIQSIYFEFGSGVVLPQTGIVWQNRGASFVLADEFSNARALKPGRRPFHTLNPALARLDDGRVMVYGTMGGEEPAADASCRVQPLRHVRTGPAAPPSPRPAGCSGAPGARTV